MAPDILIKRLRRDFGECAVDERYTTDEQLYSHLEKEGLPSLAKLLKMINE